MKVQGFECKYSKSLTSAGKLRPWLRLSSGQRCMTVHAMWGVSCGQWEITQRFLTRSPTPHKYWVKGHVCFKGFYVWYPSEMWVCILTITSPTSGIIVLLNIWKSGSWTRFLTVSVSIYWLPWKWNSFLLLLRMKWLLTSPSLSYWLEMPALSYTKFVYSGASSLSF